MHSSKCSPKDLLRFSAAMTTINLTHVFKLVAGEYTCRVNSDCYPWPGYVCHNNRCVCDPEKDSGLFSPCAPGTFHGNKCRADGDCNLADYNLVCARADKTCRCRRGYVWDLVSKRCYKLGDDDYGPNKIGTMSDLIGTLIFILGVGAMMYLLIKLFCNCSKIWRRGNSAPRSTENGRGDVDAQCIPMSNAPGTWVASYRVIGSLDPSANSQFPGRNAPVPPYLLLPTPGTAPPPYEEALKHKVILSSYPSQPPLSPLPLQMQNPPSNLSPVDHPADPLRPLEPITEGSDAIQDHRQSGSSSS
ncbi:uncharacterized protein LOC132200726 [Neocloeon triangulifer]|uniref:uncharacterized protein LOC132200726 n=1 Tax=Neocloeon triangulifer TaxID=2078957 RepID=UPI00286EE41E|nr:uncharacterized protein LOC132200726 [Neocloeon triangulifer]